MVMTITDKLDIKTLFSQMSDMFFFPTVNLDDPSKETGEVLNLPIIEDTSTFKEGEVTTTKVKLTDGQLWDSIPKIGDADMSVQVATVNDKIISLFCTKANAITNIAFKGFTYSGQGYKNDFKTVRGGFLLVSRDQTSAIWMPNIQAHGSIQMDNAKPAYVNVKYDAFNSTKDGAGAIYVLSGTAPETYSATKTYALNDLVVYNGVIYKCITAITVAEAWTIAKWEAI